MFRYFILMGITLLTMSLSLTSQAKLFRNAYVSFELPENSWSCSLEQTEWVCRSSDPKSTREAIIILTAKEVGPTDSLNLYTSHLSTSQPTAYRVKQESMSKVVYPAKQILVNDHHWIDGLHLASEIPHYYTRYLATIKDKIAVLVTLSAHSEHYTRYSKDFFKTVQSLRVIATKNLLSQPELGPVRPSKESLGGHLSGVVPSDMLAGGDLNSSQNSSSSQNTRQLIIGLALVLAALGGYLLLKGK
jgi:hypothetical protein